MSSSSCGASGISSSSLNPPLALLPSASSSLTVWRKAFVTAEGIALEIGGIKMTGAQQSPAEQGHHAEQLKFAERNSELQVFKQSNVQGGQVGKEGLTCRSSSPKRVRHMTSWKNCMGSSSEAPKASAMLAAIVGEQSSSSGKQVLAVPFPTDEA